VSARVSAAAPNLFLIIVDSPTPWNHDVAGGRPAAAFATPVLTPPADADAGPSPGTPARAAKKGVRDGRQDLQRPQCPPAALAAPVLVPCPLALSLAVAHLANVLAAAARSF
jgi:hypothetical protein